MVPTLKKQLVNSLKTLHRSAGAESSYIQDIIHWVERKKIPNDDYKGVRGLIELMIQRVSAVTTSADNTNLDALYNQTIQNTNTSPQTTRKK